jgi:hypothetical protein
VARRYLSAFHGEDQEKLRKSGKAFIPKANSNLVALRRVNTAFVAFVQSASKEMVATLDLDATLIETAKSSALYCYKHFPAYQPYNVYWVEQGLMLHSEFRDGNVPASYQQLPSIEGSSELSSLRGGEGSYPLRQRRVCTRVAPLL